jgi:hypothetical protein
MSNRQVEFGSVSESKSVRGEWRNTSSNPIKSFTLDGKTQSFDNNSRWIKVSCENYQISTITLKNNEWTEKFIEISHKYDDVLQKLS